MKNKSTLAILITGILSIIGLIGAFMFQADDIIVNIPEEKIHIEVAKKVPLEIKKIGFNVTINKIDVQLNENNTFNIEFFYVYDGYGVTGNGGGVLNSGIRYDNGKFYADSAQLSDFTISRDKTVKEKNNKIKSKISSFLNKHINNSDDIMNQLEVAFQTFKPKIKQHISEKLVATINKTVLYDLNGKDIKQSLAALALKDVHFVQDNVVVTLNPIKFISTLGLYLIFGILALLSAIALTFAFIKNPSAFVFFGAIDL